VNVVRSGDKEDEADEDKSGVPTGKSGWNSLNY
jgi:hypothetical protein